MTAHECPCCGAQFLGRKNKVYCSSECKIYTNNERARSRLTWAIPIEKKLRQNRQVLADLLGRKDHRIVSKDMLVGAGYKLLFHTHYSDTIKGAVMIYDVGVVRVDSGNYKIFRP